MVRSHLLACAATIAAIAAVPGAPAHAASITAIYSFGDSLSDTGNVFIATQGAEPATPYSNGRFTNGANWVQDVSSSLGLGAVTPSLAGGNDYAYGGAVTGSSVPGATTAVPNITQQVQQYIAATGAGNASASALYTVWIGANDIFTAVTDLGASTITQTQAAADIAGAAQTEANAVDTLAKDGAKDFLVPLVPALGLVPDLNSTPLAAAAGTALAAAYNTALLADLSTVATGDGVTIDTVDTFSLLENSVADPAAYGYANVTTGCYSGPYTGGGTVCANPGQYLFWDGVHPTAYSDTIIAAAALNAIPEPETWALLAGALAGLGLARRRKTG